MWTTMTIIIVVVTAYLVVGMLFLHSAADPGGVFPRLVQWTFWPVAVPLGRRSSGRHAAPSGGPPATVDSPTPTPTPAPAPTAAAVAQTPIDPPPIDPPPVEPPPVPPEPVSAQAAPAPANASPAPAQEDQGDLPVEDPPDQGASAAWENFVRRLSS